MKNSEILKLQTGAEGEPNKENSNLEELIERERIDNTPYTIVGNKERGYFLAFGKYKVLENKPTKAEIRNDLEKRKWFVMMDTVICLMDMVEHNKIYTTGTTVQDQIVKAANEKNKKG